MIIEKIDFYKIALKRKEKFVIATGSSITDTNVFVRIKTTGNEFGYGCCTGSRSMRETTDMIFTDLKNISKKLVGLKLEIDSIHKLIEQKLHTQAAKAALDIAVYDITAKESAKPVYKFLNSSARYNSFPTDITIGIMDLESTVRKAILYAKKGFQALKIKVGLNMAEDINRICAVRKALPKIKIRIDANQGYSVKEALQFVDTLYRRDIGVEFIEQPVRAADLKALKMVKNASKIPVMADESARTVDDAKKIIDNDCADLVNIKLMKCGGIYNAAQINCLAVEHGLGVMLGCMGESKLSISAATHFAVAYKLKNVKYADLDSHFELLNDPALGNPTFKNGRLVLAEKNGLGTRF